MADLTHNLKLIWSRLKEGWGSNMADLADRIDDLICSFEHGPGSAMDTMAMLLFGWIVFGLIVFGVGNLVYSKIHRPTTIDVTASPVPVSAKVKVPPLPIETEVPPKNQKPTGTSTPDVISEETHESVKESFTDDEKKIKKKDFKVEKVQSASVASALDLAATVRPQPPARTKRGHGGSMRSQPLSSSIPISNNRPTGLSLTCIPKTTGPDTLAVSWVNKSLQWIYEESLGVAALVDAWVQALSQYAARMAIESQSDVVLEIVRLVSDGKPPVLTNLFCETDLHDNVTLTSDFEATFALDVKVESSETGAKKVIQYSVQVDKLRGRLNIACVTAKLSCAAKFAGWPDVQLSVSSPTGQLQELVWDVVTSALRNVVLNVNLGKFEGFPHFPARPEGSFNVTSTQSSMNTSSTVKPLSPRTVGTKRLLVKVLKASGIKACSKPFCIVEMDDPSQKFSTVIQNQQTNNPLWDEHFLFDVTSLSAEILFEVHDGNRGPGSFLGLGIVGVGELVERPSQRQIIALQPRPYQEESVSGSITVEFLYMEGADLPVAFDRPVPESTRSPLRIPLSGTMHANGLQPNAAYSPTNKTVVVIQNQNKMVLEGGTFKKVPGQDTSSPSASDNVSVVTQDRDTPVTSDLERGRSRRKKRDFFGTIKKRLSRSKTRSQSMGPVNTEDWDPSQGSMARSVSADRANNDPGFLLVPANRVDDSTRSSLSEVSAVSGASNRTYVNEESILVLETYEGGLLRYYLVPLSIAQKGKWRKRGTKLHIFNDHTFIAKHLPGGLACQVCSKSVVRRLGKQGYECRDCHFRCHKHCHVKVEFLCPQSTIHAIELSLLPVLSE